MINSSEAPTTNAQDYCLWKPASTRAIDRLFGPDPDTTTSYTVSVQPKSGSSPPSTTFVMKSFTGLQLGELQCVFPRAATAESISLGQWVNIVGAHISLEVRR
jgi:hypothetical protein